MAILISLLALWIGFNLRTNSTITGRLLKIDSAVLMGTAISSMHYTDMMATHFSAVSFIFQTVGTAHIELLVDASTSFSCLEMPSQLFLIKAPD